jgi:hypothetical protein
MAKTIATPKNCASTGSPNAKCPTITGATAAAPKCRAQYSALTLVKRDTDSWYVIGDIA